MKEEPTVHYKKITKENIGVLDDRILLRKIGILGFDYSIKSIKEIKADILNVIANKNGFLNLIIIKDNVIGFSLTSIKDKKGILEHIAMDTEYRKKGYGTKLFLNTISNLRSQGVNELKPNAYSNPVINTFFEKVGERNKISKSVTHKNVFKLERDKDCNYFKYDKKVDEYVPTGIPHLKINKPKPRVK